MTNSSLRRPNQAVAANSASTAPPTVPARMAESGEWVSLINPDDPDDLPIYEGLAGAAGELLIPGDYGGFDEDAYPVSVTVPE